MGKGEEEIARARLCRLLKSSLGSRSDVLRSIGWPDECPSFYSEKLAPETPILLNVEMERDVLIALTGVYRVVKQWTLVGSPCEEDLTLETINRNDCSWHMRPPVGCQSCLANAISLLLAFLGSRSPHVQHMTCKILVVISSFLQIYENMWEEFSHVLWIELEFMIPSCSQQPPDKYATSNAAHLLESGDNLAAVLKSAHKKTDWRAPTLLMETLKLIHKSLNFENSDLSEANLRYNISSLLNFPWYFLYSKSDVQTKVPLVASSMSNDELHNPPSHGLFLGATLQLLCSLVEKTDVEAESSPLDDSSIYSKVTTLVSDLLDYFFSDCCSFDACLCRYLRHKSLALMIRLSVWTHWRDWALEPCALLIRKHFKDILLNPIMNAGGFSLVSMEGSPFQSSISRQENSGTMYTTHLHRQTLFLFIKCCYSSFRCRDEVSQNRELRFSGFSELSTWLQGHIPLTNNSEGHFYLTSCTRFSLSFLELFMDEDDLLFDMLLLLLDTPSPALRYRKKYGCHVTEEQWTSDVSHLWNVFNPIRLFHLFLHLIHYDHSVLLDYLISKDSGIPCVQYLLRCLRLACDNWEETFSDNSPQQAARCLLSLKTSVESLHRKSLFPYNPAPLLKRFTRFQERASR